MPAENQTTRRWWWLLRTFLASVGALWLIVGTLGWLTPHDDTDPPGSRSGLGLRTDAATGCQYLVAPGGGISPRLDISGHHICQEHR